MPDPQPLELAMAQVNDASVSIDDWVKAVEDDPASLAEVFATIDDTIHVLAMVRDIVKAAIVKRSHWDNEAGGWVMADGGKFPYLLPGGGYLQRRGGKTVDRYDQAALIADVAKAIAAEVVEKDIASTAVTADGELLPLSDLCQRVCARMAEAAGVTAPSFTSWRSGVTNKQLGVDMKRHILADHKTEVSLSVEGRRPV